MRLLSASSFNSVNGKDGKGGGEKKDITIPSELQSSEKIWGLPGKQTNKHLFAFKHFLSICTRKLGRERVISARFLFKQTVLLYQATLKENAIDSEGKKGFRTEEAAHILLLLDLNHLISIEVIAVSSICHR